MISQVASLICLFTDMFEREPEKLTEDYNLKFFSAF